MENNEEKKFNPEKLLAIIGTAYIEVLAGVRRPEQLARWLTDKAYFELCQKARSAARSRQATGISNRPNIILRNSKTFLTDANCYQGVVLVKVSGATKALSIRGKHIHNRFRVTDMELI